MFPINQCGICDPAEMDLSLHSTMFPINPYAFKYVANPHSTFTFHYVSY